MKIADIRAHALSSPIDPVQERPFHGGVRLLKKRDFVLVVVETADGEVGYAPAGASASAMREYFEDASQQAYAGLLATDVNDELVGTHLDDIAAAHESIRHLDLPEVLESQASAALDIALHDIRGKRAGAPIYKLLAEDRTPTTTLDLYASAGMYMEPEGYREQMATLRDCGFMGYKYRSGIGPEGDRQTFDRLVALPGEMEVMVDAHLWWKLTQGYSDETVTELVSEWAQDAYWVEEPVSPTDYDGYRSLAETGARLAGGESETSAAGLVDLADTGVSFLQGDVRHHEGYTGCLTAVERCRNTDIQYVPHHFGTLLGLVANAHLVAGVVDGRLLEYPVFESDPYIDAGADSDPGMYPFDLAFDVVKSQLAISDGTFEVPSGPGLGIEVDESVIDAYPFIEGPWTEFIYDD